MASFRDGETLHERMNRWVKCARLVGEVLVQEASRRPLRQVDLGHALMALAGDSERVRSLRELASDFPTVLAFVEAHADELVGNGYSREGIADGRELWARCDAEAVRAAATMPWAGPGPTAEG